MAEATTNPNATPPGGGSTTSLGKAMREFMRGRFDLRGDQAYEGQTLEEVRRGIQFKGANLWILLFAILICSIGLNVNSPAVVIGAMLISPLMGPILGIGVGVAIYDFELLLLSIKNIMIATIASVIVSSVYFYLSPITDAQSELLARVSPTLWDVLIATFGGFAGIIAVSRREKGNALPGVAIATALMPPICTAGYALAQGEWIFLAGSLYLFFINIVFIAVATFVLARFMRFKRHQFVDEAQEKRVRRWVVIIVAIVAIPSIYTAYITVEKSLYLKRAQDFIQEECNYEGAEIISQSIKGYKDDEPRSIELVIVGQRIDSARINLSRARLPKYDLVGTVLKILQDADEMPLTALDVQKLKSLDPEVMYKRNDAAVLSRDKRISALELELKDNTVHEDLLSEVQLEMAVLYPKIQDFQFGQMRRVTGDVVENKKRTGLIYLTGQNKLTDMESDQLSRWLATRTQLDTVIVIH